MPCAEAHPKKCPGKVPERSVGEGVAGPDLCWKQLMAFGKGKAGCALFVVNTDTQVTFRVNTPALVSFNGSGDWRGEHDNFSMNRFSFCLLTGKIRLV